MIPFWSLVLPSTSHCLRLMGAISDRKRAECQSRAKAVESSNLQSVKRDEIRRRERFYGSFSPWIHTREPALANCINLRLFTSWSIGVCHKAGPTTMNYASQGGFGSLSSRLFARSCAANAHGLHDATKSLSPPWFLKRSIIKDFRIIIVFTPVAKLQFFAHTVRLVCCEFVSKGQQTIELIRITLKRKRQDND